MAHIKEQREFKMKMLYLKINLKALRKDKNKKTSRCPFRHRQLLPYILKILFETIRFDRENNRVKMIKHTKRKQIWSEDNV